MEEDLFDTTHEEDIDMKENTTVDQIDMKKQRLARKAKEEQRPLKKQRGRKKQRLALIAAKKLHRATFAQQDVQDNPEHAMPAQGRQP